MTADEGSATQARLPWRMAAPEIYALLAMISMAALTYFLVTGSSRDDRLLTPALVAVVMVANLVPAMTLIVLVGSRIARARAVHSLSGGNGRLHVRLVALFSLIAAAPTFLVVIFASLLFQYGVDFWFSDRSRGMFENAANLAQGYYSDNQREVGANTVAMAVDLRAILTRIPIDDPDFSDYYLQQVVVRNLNESAIIEIGADGVARTAAMIDPDNRAAENRIAPDMVKRLDQGEEVVVARQSDRIEAVTRLDAARRVYLYASRDANVLGLQQFQRARAVLADYNALFGRSQQLQLQFNLALYLGSLALLAAAVVAAILVADRIVRPLGTLVGAARTAAGGDLSVRVTPPLRDDEIAVLTRAFNRMTEQLQGQTSALVSVNAQLDARRAFIETVLSGVSSGVLSVDAAQRIRLANDAALALAGVDEAQIVGEPLATAFPELATMLDEGQGERVVQVQRRDGEAATIAAKAVSLADGHIISFEDITQQLLDQRRAAWSDVARRIAHEIKNPLTPIQLAAERLQRRFGERVEGDEAVFRKLTDTIVRQVADMRRMVDEFSSFARMPNPTFGTEDLRDIVRKSLFLFEVASPAIRFSFAAPDDLVPIVCDRRLLSQACTNIIKNAVEAVTEQALPDDGSSPDMRVDVRIERDEDGPIRILVEDNGVGLPAERDAIAEPYMTTRQGGTGLGLAIVKKIVEQHLGELSFADAASGRGTAVQILLYPDRLAPLVGQGTASAESGAETVPGRIRNRKTADDARA